MVRQIFIAVILDTKEQISKNDENPPRGAFPGAQHIPHYRFLSITMQSSSETTTITDPIPGARLSSELKKNLH